MRALTFLLLLTVLVSGQEAWEGRLARAVDGRLDEIDARLADISRDLESLPRLPIDDQGGSGGFASQHSAAFPSEADPHAVEIHWGRMEEVDHIALVPARRYDASGLEPQFGMPDDFRVQGLGAEGEVLFEKVAGPDLWKDPVRAGHPFLFSIEPAVAISGLRILAGKLAPDADGEGSFVHAWAECMAFSRGRNIALGGETRAVSGMAPTAPWQWAANYLTDGQTPLGLPEKIGDPHMNVGWLSEGREEDRASVVIELDLGKETAFDALTLFPAKRPTSDLPGGFGFPGELTLFASAQRNDLDEKEIGHWTLRNPGHNPVTLKAAASGVRFVRLRVDRLWKPYEGYPAFCALSEITLEGPAGNVAAGAKVFSPDGMGNIVAPGGKYWGSLSLTDGFGPEGQLISSLEWLQRLDQRLTLEHEAHALRTEAAGLVSKWRRIGLWTAIAISLLALALLIALPIRYRARERRKLIEVRERIAGDLHDEVGSNLGSIQMFADLAEGRSGPSDELKRIQRIAAETVSAVRDIVWLLRPHGGHRIGTVEHLRETASIMLERLKWEFTANEAAWQTELRDEQNRHLFLYFREAMHNILRHSEATQAGVRIEVIDGLLTMHIHDNGRGIPAEKKERSSTLRALRQRADSLKAAFHFQSAPGEGTHLDLKIPLDPRRAPKGGA
ncbi:MAG: histidine kinase [Akkermansiaceae bacterium]|jgi:signal transduction histidine kinase|nr:histidine kinase [Akkermansiaceae bacterium]